MVVLKESICSFKEEVAELRNVLEETKKELSNTKAVEDNLLTSDGTWKTVRRGRGVKGLDVVVEIRIRMHGVKGAKVGRKGGKG